MMHKTKQILLIIEYICYTKWKTIGKGANHAFQSYYQRNSAYL